jgi:hypothetical protein
MGQELGKKFILFSGGIGSTRPNPHRQNLYLPHSDKKDSKREKEEAITDVLAEGGAMEACG